MGCAVHEGMHEGQRLPAGLTLRPMNMSFHHTGKAWTTFAAVLLSACAAGDFHENTGVKSSDPQFTGQRDMNFDRLIVPGQRVGPVALGGDVRRAIGHLGRPDRVNRSTFRGPGYDADEVYYYYADECIRFTWSDRGVNPTIQTGWRGINVTCPKWTTAEGIRVGMPIPEVVARLRVPYCAHSSGGRFMILTKQGIWFWARDRNSPVSEISVVPSSNDWGGACKD